MTPIEDEAGLDAAQARLDELLRLHDLTPEQSAELDALGDAIECYEEIHHPIPETAKPAGLDPDLDPANFEANYPSIELSPTGEGEDVVIGGMGWALDGLIIDLKQRRQEKGLSIEEVARRSELNEATVFRLENRHIQNPTLDTIFRYALAMDLLITLGTEEVEEDYRFGSAMNPST